MEQGIANDASIAAKTQLEVAKERHATTVAELKSVKDELEDLKAEHATLANEKDVAIGMAEESISVSKVIETVEDLTLELITTKELLESAQAAHLEAEEQRITVALAWEQDNLSWERELKQAEGELQHLNELLLLVNDLKTKLDAACPLLFNLKVELAAYKEAKGNQESDSTKEVKTDIEKAKEEVNRLRVSASSLKCELERETTALTTLRQREGLASAGVSSLEAELNRTTRELELISTKEKGAQEKMAYVPKMLQQAAQEADEAKSVAHLARDELRQAKEEAEQAEAGANAMEIRLDANIKEIEASRASEKLTVSAVQALEKSEQAAGLETNDSPSGVTLPMEEYHILSTKAREAEELANKRGALCHKAN